MQFVLFILEPALELLLQTTPLVEGHVFRASVCGIGRINDAADALRKAGQNGSV